MSNDTIYTDDARWGDWERNVPVTDISYSNARYLLNCYTFSRIDDSYDVYPDVDGNVNIHVRFGPDGFIQIECEGDGGVVVWVVMALNTHSQRFDGMCGDVLTYIDTVLQRMGVKEVKNG